MTSDAGDERARGLEEIGAQLLDLWVRADLLAALSQSAPWPPLLTGDEGAGRRIASLQAEIVRINGDVPIGIARARQAASDLSEQLVRISNALDDTLAACGLDTIGGRSVEELRVQLRTVIAPEA